MIKHRFELAKTVNRLANAIKVGFPQCFMFKAMNDEIRNVSIIAKYLLSILAIDDEQKWWEWSWWFCTSLLTYLFYRQSLITLLTATFDCRETLSKMKWKFVFNSHSSCRWICDDGVFSWGQKFKIAKYSRRKCW